MGNKLKAIKQTSISIIIVSLIPFILSLFFDEETLMYILMFGMVGFFVWILYSINLTSIELEERFKDKDDSN